MQLPLVLRVAGPRGREHWASWCIGAGLGLLGVVLDLARPWPLAFAFDHAIGAEPLAGLTPTEMLVAAGAAIVALTAISGLVDMLAETSAERAAEHVGARLRQDIFEHSVGLSLRWHDRMRSGELVSRLTTDVDRMLDALVAMSTTLLPELVRLAIVLAVLSAFDPRLALVALAVVPLLMVFAVRQRRLVRSVQHEARTQSGRLSATATDLVRNVRAVQAFGGSTRSSATFSGRNRSVLDTKLRAVTIEARWAPVADVVLALGSGLVLVVAGREVLDGRLSTGDLLVVMSYLSALYTPVRGLSRLSSLLAKSTASAGRVDDVLRCDERVPDRPWAVTAPRAPSTIRFASVHFAYESGRPVLEDLDLTVRAGETVALLGPSGCGKSTVLSLLLRLYDVQHGAITLDGLDVRDLQQASLRDRIAYVPQEAWLFDASIADNIAYGVPRATRHAIRTAGRAAMVEEFARRLPAGYDTVVGEGGSALSGGQRRRIAIARAAISNAPVVLLDEPTASLDPHAAESVVRAIEQSTFGRTVLIVTHDRELAAIADRVVVLDAPRSRPVPYCPPVPRLGEEVTT